MYMYIQFGRELIVKSDNLTAVQSILIYNVNYIVFMFYSVA